MRITAQGLNRATLARQLLLRRQRLGVIDAARRVVALQAQQAASPYLALWNRLTAFDPADLDAAFAEHKLVKATLMRITLHVVHADDHPAMHAAMQPTLRGARLGDRRFTVSGLRAADADAVLPELLEFAGRPRTVAEVEAWLDARLGVPPKGVWWALRSYAPLLHAPTGGPWSFGTRPSYVAAGTPPASGGKDIADQHLRTLVQRYLEGFGPASVADVAQFALVQRSRARDALSALSGVLEELEGPDGTRLFDVPGGPRPAEDTPAPPRLMAMWDSILLAYADRSRVIPPDYRKLVTRSNGDVLPTLLVDGYVAGVWRPVEGGIEATAFHHLPAEAWEGLAAEARSLVALLADRGPQPYRRYDHWWTTLPGAEVRVLPGQ
ncbi:winged helix DNA-binding domain-containing protein [Sphaerisporangium perillae]|uniref:winged helix DNA-binding domain-containing protein n=1 Tax=Sphaerisporangium perillae TaxID=2935860 RepID=UPI00200D106F|nr:winged helix DNA-binding domain-containing protein [Sphaerisporangium perillae]